MMPNPSSTINLSTVFGRLPEPPAEWPEAMRDAILKERATGKRRIIGTREAARKLLPKLPGGALVLDCTDVEVVSPPFFHELLRGHDGDITITNANPHVAESYAMTVEHMEGSSR